jgi:uncharacterized membrane protein
MITRLALLDMVARLHLDTKQASALWRLAGFDCVPPRGMSARARQGIALVGAGCTGLGVIFWVAANWDLLSRLQQFCLLQGLVLSSYLAVAASARGRVLFGLPALFATGGLFAYFGQTYQTGADTWQLFAIWAVLVLPLALCARSDAVWSAWIIVALTGIALWSDASAKFMWRHGTGFDGIRIAATSLATGLTVLLSKTARRYTGAGDWAFGIALVLTALIIIGTAVPRVFEAESSHYWFCLILTAGAATLIAHSKPFNVFAASVIGLVLNVLLFAGLLVLIGGGDSNWFGVLLVLGTAAALMLAATVQTIILLSRASNECGGEG